MATDFVGLVKPSVRPDSASSSRIVSQSDFVPGSAGALFRTCSRPLVDHGGADRRAGDGAIAADLPAILLVAPIGEEMNRSRRFLSALRQACARRGALTVLVDPFGTGDSAGEFAQATWELWLSDLTIAAESAVAESDGAGLVLLGVRSGCLLVDALSIRLVDAPAGIAHVQPESDGAAVFRRFLSARVLAERLAGRTGESVAGLEARAAGGESLELGGYEMGAALLRALREASIDPSTAPRATGRCHRFDLAESLQPSPVSISEWQPHFLPTRPFWQLAESVPEQKVVERIAEVLVP